MAGLALQGLKLGGEKLPDSAFEKIPFAGPRYFKESEDSQSQQGQDQQDQTSRNRRSRRSEQHRQREPAQYDSDPYDTNPDSDYEQHRRAQRSHRRSRREEPRRYARGYDSDPESPSVARDYYRRPRERERGSARRQEYDSNPYFPPPPTRAVDEPEVADYNAGAGHRDDYYQNHPAASETYAPPPGPPPSQHAHAHFNADPPRNGPSSNYSSAADRYRPRQDDRYNNASPSPYDRSRDLSPRPRNSRASPQPNDTSAVVLRPHSDYYGSQESLSPSYDSHHDSRYDDNDGRDSHRRRRHDDDDDDDDRRSSRPSERPSSKASRARSSSRFSEARERAREGFESHKSELGAGALGALAGGLLGREFGAGSKKANLGMVIGAALGGVGAGLYGKRQEKHAHRRDESAERHGSRRQYAGYESH